ncbi:MAG TPA: beta-ketoacyl synthase N-terminal-like domain-containing protein, partial [Thermoanaerobaculia bacterium]|nr:beta-ketoacyl synthase N-terminal-like domain-containing protein [Thermoanaerobaculia bacterium]
MSRERRVVVTGVGAVTPVGTGRREVWEALLAGRSGFSAVESFDTRAHTVHRGAEIHGFRPEEHVRRLDPGRLGRASQFAIAAAWLALADAGIDPATVPSERAGVAMGTTSGEPIEIERLDDHLLARTPEQVGGEFIDLYPCHVLASHVAAELGFEGPNTVIPTACAAGNYAVAHALDLLSARRAELMLAGGADAFSRITYTGFARLGAIAPEVCQPFDRNRKGMIPGEGAGMVVLEPLDRALARGARIYAEVAGYGLS